jgi:hypothetical protein
LVEQAEDSSSDERHSFWYTRVRRMHYVIIFTKFVSQQQKFIVQIKVLIQEGTAKCLSYSISIKEKF